MIYKLVIENKATIEMQEAFEWYEFKRDGLGDELIEEFQLCFEKITENPEHYGFIDKAKSFRRIKVNRFPYILVYWVKDSDVAVVTSASNTWMNHQY
jgi:toxin ParE1/3/4